MTRRVHYVQFTHRSWFPLTWNKNYIKSYSWGEWERVRESSAYIWKIVINDEKTIILSAAECKKRWLYMQNKKCDKSKRNEVENCILDCPALLLRSHAAAAAELPPHYIIYWIKFFTLFFFSLSLNKQHHWKMLFDLFFLAQHASGHLMYIFCAPPHTFTHIYPFRYISHEL